MLCSGFFQSSGNVEDKMNPDLWHICILVVQKSVFEIYQFNFSSSVWDLPNTSCFFSWCFPFYYLSVFFLSFLTPTSLKNMRDLFLHNYLKVWFSLAALSHRALTSLFCAGSSTDGGWSWTAHWNSGSCLSKARGRPGGLATLGETEKHRFKQAGKNQSCANRT